MTRRMTPRQEALRTFGALPPAKGSRAPFAESWWGRAWLRALEESSLDSGRLQRGRTYARGGAVGQVTVAPGNAAAPVQGSRRTPYRSTVRVEQLGDRQWDRLLDVIAERAANIAALLDGEMPAGLADDAAAAGVALLPGPGDLAPECSCPDWGYPCNRWTVEGRDAQLRLSREGLWYPYTKDRGAWWPAGPPDADPAVVLAAVLGR